MSTRPLTDAQRLDWLRLARTEGVGPITFRNLLRRYGSAAAALDALPDLARRGGRGSPLRPFDKTKAQAEIDAHQRCGAKLIAWDEPDYPESLAATEDAPPLLTVLGHGHLLQQRCVAIVGARNASLNGQRMAGQLARDLGAAGIIVVSGLARGMDAAAHRAALVSGTIAVMACGANVIYPPENADLHSLISQTGAIISEMPLDTDPQARLFPRRNRIISGLSLGVVVVEAADHSGSLITAQRALDQGREIFAVPGSPLDPRCKGSNGLLRQGANLVENAADILNVLNAARPRQLNEISTSALKQSEAEGHCTDVDVAEARLLLGGLLGPSPVQIDDLIRACDLNPAAVLTALLELELAGLAVREPGQRVYLLSSPETGSDSMPPPSHSEKIAS